MKFQVCKKSGSAGFIRKVHSRTGSFAAVNTQIVTGHFRRQETKRALDEVDMYLQSIENLQKLANVFY